MKISLFRSCMAIVAVATMSFLSPHSLYAMGRPKGVPDKTLQQADEASAQDEASASPGVSPEDEAIAASRNAQVTVLGYHRFVKNVRRPDTEITPEEFEAQMQALKDQGITVISLTDFLAWKEGKKAIPAQSAVITFDDGWRSQYELAWPILQKFGYPLTSFIYTDYVKGGKRTGGESMSWEELAEMRDGGVDIQSHTISHSDLRGKKGVRDTPEYEAWLWEELAGSKRMIEEKLGVKVHSLALPYGFYNAKVQEVAAKAGYDAIFTVNGQKVTMNTPLDAVGRTIIESNKPKLFAQATRFNNSSGGGGAAAPAVAEVPTRQLSPSPADGSTITEMQPEIRANLKSLGEVKPESIHLRISGIGQVKGEYDPESGLLTYRPRKPLEASTYTVIITAEAGGRKQEGRWKFTVGAPEEAAPTAKAEGEDAAATQPESSTAGDTSSKEKPEAVGEKESEPPTKEGLKIEIPPLSQ